MQKIQLLMQLSFIIAPKKRKFLDMHTIRHVQNLYAENSKMLKILKRPQRKSKKT